MNIRRTYSNSYHHAVDPNTVNVRIQSASTSDLNVQDVSSDSESDPSLSAVYSYQRDRAYSCIKMNHKQQRHKQPLSSSNDTNNDVRDVRRLNTDTITSTLRPITANSLPSKPNDDWDPQNSVGMVISRRNPSCPIISSPVKCHSTTSIGIKESNSSSSHSSTKTTNTQEQHRLTRNRRKQSLASTSPTTTSEWKHREISPGSQAPLVFQTTSEILGTYSVTDPVHPFLRDSNRRSRSATKSPSSSIVITDENCRNFIPLTLHRSHQQQHQPSHIGEHNFPSSSIVAITDDIFIGTLRSLQNERQLCKLTIDYLINASNMRPDEIARKSMVGSKLPCTCGQQHSRCILTVEYLESQKTAKYLYHLFDEINKFIMKSKLNGKKVLVYGYDYSVFVIVIAIQYLMSNCDYTLPQAYEYVMQLIPGAQSPDLDKTFYDHLKQLDAYLQRDSFPKQFNDSRSKRDTSSSSSSARRNISPITSAVVSSASTSFTSYSTGIAGTRTAWDS
ncbi:unnamed protein product [Didymodactylos carnosus]|uniref:Tyrosine-protein phosphatase domain-containing protein n=1 Tax=Didymodactylos carnosus TaxID=1234261 RepID=A0A814CUF7_9BILA|nr:unnamed protein product [Didymodactylos carnosus]CAF1436539.1 unnamed protein product [Didymodactylos carnosus]CAF3723104.1 unnamed protein product [Didymodactylos carnosus]CAF4233681.1 unnamed protein product [Didymodactylos carnosus]